jgi:hypothetical protein
MWGLAMARSTPACPLRISSGRPAASGRLLSRPATVNDGVDIEAALT